MASDAPLRLMVYDRTCTPSLSPPALVGRLTPVWWVGAYLYGGLGRFDAWFGATSWPEALGWLGSVGRDGRRIAEIQYWGHGNWGLARIGAEPLDSSSLAAGHPHAKGLDAVRERLTPDATLWFRTCDTLGSARGHAFAARLTDRLGCAVAGHTHVIGPWQSGLHKLAPGASPHWPASEGVRDGTPEAPRGSTWSTPGRPNTITFLHGAIPEGW